uniref:Uncharacterized protein n=1 Tax=Arundo donax TaxID=35708 RepID=A0A0A9BNQ5_ARUDO
MEREAGGAHPPWRRIWHGASTVSGDVASSSSGGSGGGGLIHVFRGRRQDRIRWDASRAGFTRPLVLGTSVLLGHRLTSFSSDLVGHAGVQEARICHQQRRSSPLHRALVGHEHPPLRLHAPLRRSQRPRASSAASTTVRRGSRRELRVDSDGIDLQVIGRRDAAARKDWIVANAAASSTTRAPATSLRCPPGWILPQLPFSSWCWSCGFYEQPAAAVAGCSLQGRGTRTTSCSSGVMDIVRPELPIEADQGANRPVLALRDHRPEQPLVRRSGQMLIDGTARRLVHGRHRSSSSSWTAPPRACARRRVHAHAQPQPFSPSTSAPPVPWSNRAASLDPPSAAAPCVKSMAM